MQKIMSLNFQSAQNRKGVGLREKDSNKRTTKSVLIDLHDCDSEKQVNANALQECAESLMSFLDIKIQGSSTTGQDKHEMQKEYSLAQLFEGGSLSLHFDLESNAASIELFSEADFGLDKITHYLKKFFQAKSMKLTVFAQ